MFFIFFIGYAAGNLCIFVSVISLLTSMTIHLVQFRVGATEPFKLCPPPCLVNIGTIFRLCLNLFWIETPGCPTKEVRDSYHMDFEVFKSLGWCFFYLFSAIVFSLEGGPWTSRSVTIGRQSMWTT